MPSQPLQWFFDLAASTPLVSVSGGSIREANAETFPALSGNGLSVYLLDLEPGGIRIPHWHPNAAEVDYLLEGRAEITIQSPPGEYLKVPLAPGQVSVIPQGWFHYISTRDGERAKLLVIFSNDQPTDIGLSEGCRGIPPEVLGLTFATDPSRFADLDRSIGYIAPVQAKKDV